MTKENKTYFYGFRLKVVISIQVNGLSSVKSAVGQTVIKSPENVKPAVLDLETPNWMGIVAGRDMMDVQKELVMCHQNTILAWLRKVNQ